MMRAAFERLMQLIEDEQERQRAERNARRRERYRAKKDQQKSQPG
jgi:hypothetical protein